MSPQLFSGIAAILLGTTIASTAIAIRGSRTRRKTPQQDSSPTDSLTRFYITLSSDAIAITSEQLTIANTNTQFKSLLGTEILLDNQRIGDLLKLTDGEGKPTTASKLAGSIKGNNVAHFDSLFMLDNHNNRVHVALSIYKVSSGESQSVLVWKFANLTSLQEIEQQQSEFIAVISHELRTPVTVIEASTSSLLGSKTESLSASQSKLVQATRENALLLSKLLADLSVYSRLQDGMVHPQMSSVSPRILVDQMQKAFTAQAEEKNIALVVDHDQNVRNIISGESHLLSILQNFIKNAIQFSDPGAVVIIATKAAADGVVFMVRDTGKGLTAEEKQRIFENTFHAHADTKHQTLQGVGVGLYISAQLAKAVGATLWVDSEPGKGATFYLKVPVTYTSSDSKEAVHGLEVTQFAQDI